MEPGQIRGNLREESDVAHFPSQAQEDHLPQTLVVCYGPFNQIVLFIPSAWLSHAPNEMTAACDTYFAKPVPYEELGRAAWLSVPCTLGPGSEPIWGRITHLAGNGVKGEGWDFIHDATPFRK